MNLAIRGIEANLGDRADDTFHRDLHPDLKADFVLANPPFNDERLVRRRASRRSPLEIRHTAASATPTSPGCSTSSTTSPPTAQAGFVLANGSCRRKTSGEGDIRRKLVEADLVDCIVALPDRLFLNTGVPVCLWFVSKNRHGNGYRDRKGEILFIHARKLGRMETRTLRVLDPADIAKIADTYHTWRSENPATPYEDVPGFAKAAKLDEM